MLSFGNDLTILNGLQNFVKEEIRRNCILTHTKDQGKHNQLLR